MPDIYGSDPRLSEFRTKASTLADEAVAPHASAVDAEARYPAEAMDALAKSGLLGLCVSADRGGQGQGPAAFAAVTEELAQRCASTAMIYVMHITAGQQIAASSTLADKETILKAIAAGKHLTTLAFSERGSRSQFWAPVSKLEKNGDGYKTNAFKSWVTTAEKATSYVSSAQMPGAASPAESTLYLAYPGRKGVQIAGGFDGLGLRGNDSRPVELVDAEVTEGDLLTEHGKGADGMLTVVLPWFTIGTSAMAHGLALAATAATARHLSGTGFEHTGNALRDLPNLRARLAEMTTTTEQSRALLGHTLREMAEPDETTPLWVLRTRMAALQTAVKVTDLAMKTCGGAAFSRHLGVERMFRDSRAGWVMAPTVDHLADFLGRALTGLPLM